MKENNIEIIRLANELQAYCQDLPLGKRLRISNLCRRIRLRAKGLKDIEPAPRCETSQKKLILEYLKLGQPITPIEALQHFGCFRLGARIADLKKDGYDIRTEIITDPESKKRYASYTLNEDKPC